MNTCLLQLDAQAQPGKTRADNDDAPPAGTVLHGKKDLLHRDLPPFLKGGRGGFCLIGAD